ncbi:hypothetical protein [Allocoleopsis sp.]|uniref:hypothetical protein n=1 Tax=Allocoleopsis sp. TaxID=3088169 RepID=UPI002FD294C2
MENQHNHTAQNSSTHLQNGRNLNTHVESVNPESVSYEDGYVHGRAAERSVENEHQDVRAENSAARGLILGFLLTSLVGLVVGAIFYFNQREESPTPVLVPVPSTPQQQNRETKIIEKTTERTQSAPSTNQQPAAGSQQRQPDIKIIVPNSGQQPASSPQNTSSPTTPTPTQNQPLITNPRSIQPNSSTSPSTTTEPNKTNQSSQTPSRTDIPSARTKTESSDTTNETSTGQSQNQTQPKNSSSAQ